MKIQNKENKKGFPLNRKPFFKEKGIAYASARTTLT